MLFVWQVLMIMEDNRLSAKTLIIRDFITSMHKIMPIILKKHGLYSCLCYDRNKHKQLFLLFNDIIRNMIGGVCN